MPSDRWQRLKSCANLKLDIKFTQAASIAGRLEGEGVKMTLERSLTPVLKQAYLNYPIVVLTGPRGAGKTSLLKATLSESEYQWVSFDDPETLQRFQMDPIAFIKQHLDRTVFEEVHFAPELFEYLRLILEQGQAAPGHYVLSCSAIPTGLATLISGLPGKVGLLTLLPLDYSELPEAAKNQAEILGSYPELVLSDYVDASGWYAAQLDQVARRDISALLQVHDTSTFQRFIQLLATQVSQVLNMSYFANALNVSVPTVKRWLWLLEASYLVFTIAPYTQSKKRMTKAHKLYFYDNGLVSYLTCMTDPQLHEQGPLAQALFENWVISELYKAERHSGLRTHPYYYRTAHGVEVDWLIKREQGLEWVDIKHMHTFKPRLARPLLKVVGQHDQGYLVYRGQKKALRENIQVLSAERFFSI